MSALRRLFVLAAATLASGSALAAGPTPLDGLIRWNPGWDVFNEPMDLQHSAVVWSTNPTVRMWTLTFQFVQATPNKSYQIAGHFFCKTFPAMFGQFPTSTETCGPLSRQGVTKSISVVEFGAVTTDRFGNGSFTVEIGPIPAGTFSLEFIARNGTGCNLQGGGGDGPSDCNGDFQSPGPTFGDALTFTMP